MILKLINIIFTANEISHTPANQLNINDLEYNKEMKVILQKTDLLYKGNDDLYKIKSIKVFQWKYSKYTPPKISDYKIPVDKAVISPENLESINFVCSYLRKNKKNVDLNEIKNDLIKIDQKYFNLIKIRRKDVDKIILDISFNNFTLDLNKICNKTSNYYVVEVILKNIEGKSKIVQSNKFIFNKDGTYKSVGTEYSLFDNSWFYIGLGIGMIVLFIISFFCCKNNN
ncbi:hypothetical protein NUSPORA_00480 [Nucleospora cyclopteri]